ncbi:MAG: EAL domain-containing protein [Bacillota bacterium]|nr:EAL domain-containing protein [Bacillota bacterium]
MIKIISRLKNIRLKSKLAIVFILQILILFALGIMALRYINQAGQIDKQVHSGIILAMICTIIISITIIVVSFVYFSRNIAKQLKKEIQFAEELACGNLQEYIEVQSNDEIGLLAKALNKAAENTLGLVQKVADKEEELRQQMEELKITEEKLRISEERHRLALEGANEGIWDVDIKTKHIYISNRGQEILEIREYVDSDYFLIWELKKIIDLQDLKEFIRTIRSLIKNTTPFYHKEMKINTSNNQVKYILIRGKNIWDSKGQTVRMVGSISDITEKKKTEETINFLAYYNALTSLPNRVYINRKLPELIERLGMKNRKGAVLFLDLDNFKTVNDTLGHDAGDELLQKIADIFRTCIKANELVCHLGGDEFIFFTPNINKIDDAKEFANRLLNKFNKSFKVKDQELYVTASIGIAIYPVDGWNLETLLKNADTAMYQSKGKGKNGYRLFTREMNSKISERVTLQNNLRKAIEKNEFFIEYQPKIDIYTGRMESMEALIRWHNPNLGVVSPARFIPLAEETGLIIPIGEYVLETACRQNKLWQQAGNRPVRVAVNLSVSQFQQKNLVNYIESILKLTGLDPKWLEVEITESVVVNNFDRTIKILGKLKDMGIMVSLDDFGTGYSSLNYLRMLPLNALKIDKSFIKGLCSQSKESLIASSLINLAHGINLKVIAEGVENADQYNILKRYGCDEVQGYYFSKPVSANEFELLLRKTKAFKL